MKISKTELKEVIREAISEVVLDEKFSLGGAYEKMIQKEMDRIAKNALGLVTQQIAKKYKVGKPSPVEKGTKVTKRLVSTMIGNGMKELRNKARGPNLKKAYQKLIDKIDKDTQKYKKLGEGKKITLGDKGRKFTLDIENEAQMFLARLKKDKKKLTLKNFSDYIDAEYKFFNSPKLNHQVFNYIKKNLKKLSEGKLTEKVSDKQKRKIYKKAFGKEYDEKRQQAALPLDIAYQVALYRLKKLKEGKLTEGKRQQLEINVMDKLKVDKILKKLRLKPGKDYDIGFGSSRSFILDIEGKHLDKVVTLLMKQRIRTK